MIVLLLFMMNIYMNAEVNVQMSVYNFNLLKLVLQQNDFSFKVASFKASICTNGGGGGVNVDAD